jgi:hypothetical protein
MIILGRNIVGVGGEKFSSATDLVHQKHYSRAKVSPFLKQEAFE